ncbi:glycosyltransferase [Amnibacterium soli]|uniref:Glycosyltransferase n=2 Tax=Amnibacterium soli TaxID=1282736 RepID=A0ABP8ZEU7_9MICO
MGGMHSFCGGGPARSGGTAVHWEPASGGSERRRHSDGHRDTVRIVRLSTDRRDGRTSKVALVTVTYGDRAQLVSGTVRSGLQQGAAEAIVIANGASLASLAALERMRLDEGLPLRVLDLGINHGSAAGFAAGLEAARASDADFAWILDDDNRPDAGCLSRALETFRAGSETEAALAVCCVREADLAALEAGAPLEAIRPRDGHFCGVDAFERLARRLRRSSPVAEGAVLEIEYNPYGGMLVQVEDIDRTEPPDTRFVLYSDDFDWTRRLHRAGVRLVMDTGAVVRDAVDRWGDDDDGGGYFTRMIRSRDRARAYFALRNSIHFSRACATSAGSRMRFLGNGVLVSLWLAASSFRMGRAGFLRLYLRAWRDSRAPLGASPYGMPGGIAAG